MKPKTKAQMMDQRILNLFDQAEKSKSPVILASADVIKAIKKKLVKLKYTFPVQ
jgi:hypothetical protein